MNKAKELAAIAHEIEQCEECKKDTTGMMVPGEGNPNAKIVFVGEAPGKNEAATGRPFVGRSGKLLRETMRKHGIIPKTVFITSVGKYLPKKGTPSSSQIAHSRPYLLRQIAIIDPAVIVLLGSVAAQGVLSEKIPIMKLHGTTVEKDKRIYFLTVHPAAALRFKGLKEAFLHDFAVLQRLLVQNHLVKSALS